MESPGSLSTSDLTWSELADALYLASLGPVPAGPPPGGQPVPVPPSAPARSDPPDAEPAAEAGGQPAQPPPGRVGQPTGEPPSHPMPEDPAVTSVGAAREPGHGDPAGEWHPAVAERGDVAPDDGTAPDGGPVPRDDEPGTRAWGRPLPPLVGLRYAPPGFREMGRALRPFNRKVPSPWRRELDEEGTAEHAAEGGLWLPCMRPAADRWLDLTVVIDDSATMQVWQQTVAVFVAQLRYQGAFRDLQVRLLRVGTAKSGEPVAYLYGLDPMSAAHNPTELRDPTGRRAVLVLTDGMNAFWATPVADRMLAGWATAGPTAVVHMFPQQYWRRTAVSPQRAQLYPVRRGSANSDLRVRVPLAWQDPFETPVGSRLLPVPVLELDARWLGWWARLVAEVQQEWLDAAVLLPGATTRSVSAEPGALNALDRVLHFRSSASPMAYRLATHLAAAPLDPLLVRHLQQTLVPESHATHLAEVLVSGLVTPAEAGGERVSASSPAARLVPLDFVDGAREALLAGATRADSAQVLRVVSQYYGDQVPAVRTVPNALLRPDEVPDPVVTEAEVPFVRAMATVFQAMSGPYAARGHRLSEALTAHAADHVQPGNLDRSSPGGSHSTTAGNQMTDITENSVEAATRGRDHQASEPLPDRPDAPPVAALRPEATSVSATAALIERRRVTERPLLWGDVPAMNPNFTGRENLLTMLHEQLTAGRAAAVLPHAIHGMGGVGKSQLAVEYVYRHASDYDVIWWIPAEQPGQVLSALVELAQQLELTMSAEANLAVPAVRDALRAGVPYSNWLLVFDNAESPEAVRPYIPTGGAGKVLVTSRNQEWSNHARTLEVDVFQREESIELLRRRTPEVSHRDADLLAAALGDLPLAVEQAASWLAATGMAVDEYLDLLEAQRTELLDVAAPAGYSATVAAAWNVSLERLRSENQGALQLLQVCAFFSPEPITRALFAGAPKRPIATELDAALSDPIKLGRAIRDIQRYALARVDHRHNTLQLHRLVQAVLIDRMPKQRRADMLHGAHVLLAAASPSSPRDATQWPRYQALRSHITASKAVECDDPWVRQLVVGVIQFLYQWGDHEGCRLLAREAIETWRVRLGEDDPQTLIVMKWYGFILRVLGRYQEAAQIDRQALDLYRASAGEDDEETIDAVTNVTSDLRAQGEFQAARDLTREALDRCRRLFGDDDPATLDAAHKLGVSLRLTGEFEAARKMDEDTWQRRVQVLGHEHEATLSTLTGLSIDHREAGAYLAARELQEGTYQRMREVFGVDNPDSIRASRVLAVARRKAGDASGALEISADAAERFRRRYGDDHPDTIAAELNFSVDLRQTGELPSAHEVGERALRQYAHLFGPTHPHTLSARTNLAITLRLRGELDAAHQHNAEALAALQASLGVDHPVTLTCATNLASDRYARGDYQAAYELDTDTLERSRRMLGEDHPSTLACSLNLALDLRALNRVQESETIYANTMTRFRTVLGEAHPATLGAAQSLRANCDVDPMPL